MDACYASRFQQKQSELIAAQTPEESDKLFYQLEADVIEDYEEKTGYELLNITEKNAVFQKMVEDILRNTAYYKSIVAKSMLEKVATDCLDSVRAKISDGRDRRQVVDQAVKQLLAESKKWPDFKGKSSLVTETIHTIRNLPIEESNLETIQHEPSETLTAAQIDVISDDLVTPSKIEEEAQYDILGRSVDGNTRAPTDEISLATPSNECKTVLKVPQASEVPESTSKKKVSFAETAVEFSLSEATNSDCGPSMESPGSFGANPNSQLSCASTDNWNAQCTTRTNPLQQVSNRQSTNANSISVTLPDFLSQLGIGTTIMEAVATVENELVHPMKMCKTVAPEQIGELPEHINIRELKFAGTKHLGEGSFAVVQTARFRNTLVAVKRNQVWPCDTYAERNQAAKRELRAAKELRHDHLLPTYAYCWENHGEGSKCLNLVVEYCSYGDLKEFIRPSSSSRAVYSYRHVIDYSHQLMSVLAYLHDKGYWHRDMKPENILVFDGDAGPRTNLKVCDLGMNKSESTVTNTCFRGTYRYAAPETLTDKYTGASDVYSFGLILWEMLTRRQVYENCDNAWKQIYATKEVPAKPVVYEELQEFLYSCLESDPSRRPTPGQALVELEQLREHPSYAFDGPIYCQQSFATVPQTPLYIRDEQMEAEWIEAVNSNKLHVMFNDAVRRQASAAIDERNAKYKQAYLEYTDRIKKYHAEYEQKYLPDNYLHKWSDNIMKVANAVDEACVKNSDFIEPFKKALKNAKLKDGVKFAEITDGVVRSLGTTQNEVLKALAQEDPTNVEIYEHGIRDLISATLEGCQEYADGLWKLATDNVNTIQDFAEGQKEEVVRIEKKMEKKFMQTHNEEIVRQGFRQLSDAAKLFENSCRKIRDFVDKQNKSDKEEESNSDSDDRRGVKEVDREDEEESEGGEEQEGAGGEGET